MSVANGGSKLIAAGLIDRFSMKKLILINLGIQVFLNLTITLISSNKYFYLIYCFTSFFIYGFQQVIYYTYPVKVFGLKKGVYYSTLIVFMQILSYVAAGVLTYFFLDFIGYDELFHVYAVFSVITFLLAMKMDFKEASNFDD